MTQPPPFNVSSKKDAIYASVKLALDTIPDATTDTKERITRVVADALFDISRIADALEVIAARTK
jgi:hypothetical protein